jgi:hypothetical protein
MVRKRFLILDEGDFEDLEQRVENFVVKTFGKPILDKVEIKVEAYETELNNVFIDEVTIKLSFKEFPYINKVHGVLHESISMTLESKGYQPFYIDGKFVSMIVCEWVQGGLIQHQKEIYGVDTNKLYEMFNDFMLTC